MRRILAATFILAASLAHASASNILVRTMNRGDWQISVLRNVFDDQIALIAASKDTPLIGAPGAAALGIRCEAGLAMAFIQWPVALRAEAGGAMRGRVRVGTGRAGIFYAGVGGSARLVPAFEPLTWSSAPRPEMERSASVTIGLDADARDAAVIISTAGLAAAWKDMDAFCDAKTVPDR